MTSDIELFPGTKLSPAVLIHQTLADVDQAKAMLILTLDKDDTIDIAMSCMTMADLSFMLVKMQIHVTRMLNGDYDDERNHVYDPDPAA